jgi:uncharacterized Zn finger protein
MIRDACPKCKEKFEKEHFKVVWHDVLECCRCGHIWVALDYQEALRWLKEAPGRPRID